LPTDVVVFLGFPPRRGREREKLLERVVREVATFVLFESPHRLIRTLGELHPETQVAVCRELTKLHEEVFRGTAGEAAGHFAEGVRGEIVLIVRGGTEEPPDFEEIVERAREYIAQGESPSRAAARAAKESGRKRSEVYDRLVKSR
jgi:16S rRNA (cytidine1402-2'-O)-methyltransferase